MAVNKVTYAGRVLIDLSDSTATASNTLNGVIGYGANGERFVGTADMSNLYATGRKIPVALPVSGWNEVDGVYSQTVTAAVSATDKAIAQILLTDDDLETMTAELAADENLIKVDLCSGYIQVEIAELPEVELSLEVAIIEGLAASNKAAVMCANGETRSFILTADAWVESGEYYTQTVAVDGLTDGITYGDILLPDDSNASREIAEALKVGKFVTANGSITAIAYVYPPKVDLQYFIKTFKESE